ncbi:hypothetical protein TNCV_3846171 [Trichonephila clavipes]|nr:hypothetical protein TNCV_3846171 [Trichonephila clavipes]
MNLKTSLIFCQNGFGTTLVGPVSTSHHYRIWKSGSVAGLNHVLRVRLSLHQLFVTQFWRARSSFIWKNRHCVYELFRSDGDKGVDLNFFRVGRSPSCQVWEAYQPQNKEAYPLDLTHFT